MPYYLSLALAVCCLFTSVQAQDAPADSPSPLKTDKDKDSYAIGMDIGNSIMGQNLDIDLELLIRGLRDVASKKDTLLTKEQYQKQMFAFRDRMIAKMKANRESETREKFADQIKENEAYLAKNKAKEGVKTTDSGLQYEVLKSGTGATPTKADLVQVHYRGTLIDGKEFDISDREGDPVEFPVTGVIPGWTEVLQLMKVGDKWRVVIPSELAYGANGAGGKIQPFSTLIFEVELMGVKPPRQ